MSQLGCYWHPPKRPTVTDLGRFAYPDHPALAGTPHATGRNSGTLRRNTASEYGMEPHRVDHAAMNPGPRAADRGHARNGRERGRLFTGGVMVMIHPERDRQAERDRIAAEIAKLRVDQDRLPSHWVEKRELLAQEIEALVNEWLDARG